MRMESRGFGASLVHRDRKFRGSASFLFCFVLVIYLFFFLKIGNDNTRNIFRVYFWCAVASLGRGVVTSVPASFCLSLFFWIFLLFFVPCQTTVLRLCCDDNFLFRVVKISPVASFIIKFRRYEFLSAFHSDVEITKPAANLTRLSIAKLNNLKYLKKIFFFNILSSGPLLWNQFTCYS